MSRTPKSESNAVTALLRNFKNVPNTGKNTPNNLPAKPVEAPAPMGTTPQDIVISQEILGGNVIMGDVFTVSAVNPDGTCTLIKQTPVSTGEMVAKP